MATWPKLITPISPKMMARPSEASAKIRVSRIASTMTLTSTDIQEHTPCASQGWPSRPAPQQRGPGNATSVGFAFPSLFQWIIAARIKRHRLRHRHHLFEHVADPGPTLTYAHQVGWQDGLMIELAHLDRTLRSILKNEVLQSLAQRCCANFALLLDGERRHVRGVVHCYAHGIHQCALAEFL